MSREFFSRSPLNTFFQAVSLFLTTKMHWILVKRKQKAAAENPFHLDDHQTEENEIRKLLKCL